MSADEDIAKLKAALAKEREGHKATQKLLSEAKAALETNDALSNPNVAALKKHVDDAIAAALAIEHAKHQKDTTDLRARADGASASLGKAMVEHAIKEACRAAFVVPSAIDNAIKIGLSELKYEDGKVVDGDGRDAAGWIDQQKAVSPHWWPLAVGSGTHRRLAGGDVVAPRSATEQNPFKAGPGWNLTDQGRILSQDPARAERLKAEAQ